jgi:hypothetical protein
MRAIGFALAPAVVNPAWRRPSSTQNAPQRGARWRSTAIRTQFQPAAQFRGAAIRP